MFEAALRSGTRPVLLDLEMLTGYFRSAAHRTGAGARGGGRLGRGTATMGGGCLRKVPWSVLISSVLIVSGARAAPAPVVLAAASTLPSDASLPILRGIAFVEGDDPRVYLEDPRTGIVTVYRLGDTVGESHIERVQRDRVTLRRGDDVVHLLFGVHSTARSSEPRRPAIAPPTRTTPDASPMSEELPPPQAERTAAPIIGSGQPWLDRLGIPRGALSQAIESAEESND